MSKYEVMVVGEVVRFLDVEVENIADAAEAAKSEFKRWIQTEHKSLGEYIDTAYVTAADVIETKEFN